VYELAAGIKRVPAGKKRRFLDEWFADLLASNCDVLALDRDAALACAELEATARHQRRVVEHRDLLILGTAKARSMGVATRNVTHLRGLGVPIYDPFDDVYIL
jgi:predicted nucleic acid-binding protein